MECRWRSRISRLAAIVYELANLAQRLPFPIQGNIELEAVARKNLASAVENLLIALISSTICRCCSSGGSGMRISRRLAWFNWNGHPSDVLHQISPIENRDEEAVQDA